jgi:transcriptional regulator with XRE-family HTH domain
MMKTLSEVKAGLLKDKATRDAYTALEDEFSIARELIAARSKAGLTQLEVAERMGTKQSVIARMESGRALPSLRTLARYARALGCTAKIKLTRDQPDRKTAA